MSPSHARPSITDYIDPVEFVRDMLNYRKRSERSFSVLAATKNLRRVSPALVSLILKGNRKITVDRIDEFAKLLNLNAQERAYFKTWIAQDRDFSLAVADLQTAKQNRKEVGTHILSDWLHVYVKDCFQITKIQNDPSLIYKHLASYASKKRIDRSIQFLMSEGHLRKTMDGRIVIETPLALAQSPVPSKKIRQFHKAALQIAKNSLELFPTTERMANTMTIPLNEKSYQELLQLIQEFAEKTQEFAVQNSEGDRLYQLIVNLSPTGGKLE